MRSDFEGTELERRGHKLELGVPVTCSALPDDTVAVGMGDGSVRFFRPGLPPTTMKVHENVILSMVADGNHVLTGGDDGRFVRVSPAGKIEEISNFKTKWVDCVAAGRGFFACSSGRNAYVWAEGRPSPLVFEHPSTVGGLAFDIKSDRLAVAHYGGVTLWERGKRRWKSSILAWKGFHGLVTFSPDSKYIVTAMQENALHGWRIRDKGNLAMSGYPSKVKSLAWVGDIPFLATSGADEAICWPFDGKFGPMERTPTCLAKREKHMATCVYPLPGEQAMFVGYQDGVVLLTKLEETSDAIVIRGSTGAEVTAIAVSPDGSHVFTGDAGGNLLWSPLWSGENNARNV